MGAGAFGLPHFEVGGGLNHNCEEDPLEKEMAPHSSVLGCLENSMDRGAWRATVHGVAQSLVHD